MAAKEDQSLRWCRDALEQDAALAKAVGDVQRAERLSGLTNRVFRITTPAGVFVLRLPRPETAGAIDRAGEWHDLQVAAELGITVPPLYGNVTTGVLLLPWVEARGEVSAVSLGRCLARLHGSVVPFSGHRDLLPYLNGCESAISSVPGYLKLVEPPCRVVRGLLRDIEPRPPVPCHFDISPGNLLPQDEKILLIDFEYAAMSQAGWDLAYASLENSFGKPQEQAMLQAYADAGGIVCPERELGIYKAVCDTVSALWALGQEMQGSDADDLVLFAQRRVARATDTLKQLPDVFVA